MLQNKVKEYLEKDIIFPRSASALATSHSIGFPNFTDATSKLTDLNIEAESGTGTNTFTGGTLRLLGGMGRNTALNGNVFVADQSHHTKL